jgi:hypothetical protein
LNKQNSKDKHLVCKLSFEDIVFKERVGGLLRVSSTNKTDRHDIAEILLKVALNTTTLTLKERCQKWLMVILRFVLVFTLFKLP